MKLVALYLFSSEELSIGKKKEKEKMACDNDNFETTRIFNNNKFIIHVNVFNYLLIL